MGKGIAAVAAFVVIFGIAVWFVKREGERKQAGSVILTSVQKLNQLATVKYTMQQVVGIKEPKQPVGEESILLILQATVEGGVDLSGMQAEGVYVRPDGTVVVRVSPGQTL